ncbi:hypothetical protein AJ78_04664 [Emergomyces pasteurianus Ep9510]|uniref:Uncharacterized protein n=1 Tax=Emergomyces pasteurianus Ep9510 TaxID=1447872 RepID=A0A1J9PEV2_9EURO|nr:hypothetical protein AJ78_04664 [Emergomyces pasteurianus Ep9510]
MPRNARRSVSEPRKKTPTTLRLSFPKPPVPVPVPDNDEIEEVDEDEDEDDIETQLEDPRYPRNPSLPERILTPEPDFSYRLYEKVTINGIKNGDESRPSTASTSKSVL